MKRLLLSLLFLLPALALADSKISALTDGSPTVGTDNYVIQRSTSNYKIPASSIATYVLGSDSEISCLSGLTSAADKAAYFTGSGTCALTDFTSTARSLLDDSSTSAMRTTLGLTIGTDVQAYDVDLGVIAGLADPNADRILFWDDSAGAYAYLTAGSGLSISGTTITATGGSGTFADNAFTLQDDGDNTKQGVFQLSGISAGNTRTLTWPNISGMVATFPAVGSQYNGGWVASSSTTGQMVSDQLFRYSGVDLRLGYAGIGTTPSFSFYGTTSGTVTLKPADAAGTWTWVFPTTDGNASECLKTDGSGVTSWGSCGSGIGGSTGATDNALLRADGTGGSTLQESVVTMADTTGMMTFPTGGGAQTSTSNTNTLLLNAYDVNDTAYRTMVTLTAGNTPSIAIGHASGSGTMDNVAIGGTTAAAGTFTTATANSFIPNNSSVPSNGMYLPAANTPGWSANSAAEMQLTSSALSPAVSDGNALGTTSLMWADLFLASGGVVNFNNGDVTVTHSSDLLTVAGGNVSATIDSTSVNRGYRDTNAQTGTSYGLVASDAGKMVTLSNASAITLTIPANASVAFPVGTEIDILQLGAGQVTVAITSDTLNSYNSLTKLAGQYAGATLKKTGTTTWVLVGNLSS